MQPVSPAPKSTALSVAAMAATLSSKIMDCTNFAASRASGVSSVMVHSSEYAPPLPQRKLQNHQAAHEVPLPRPSGVMPPAASFGAHSMNSSHVWGERSGRPAAAQASLLE